MSTHPPNASRVRLLLPKLTPRDAAVLIDVLSDLIHALWDIHDDQLCDILAEGSHDDPHSDLYAAAEPDDDGFAE